MSDTWTLNPQTLTLADLTQSDPPPVARRGQAQGLQSKFQDLIRQNPGVWYEYPKLVGSRGTSRGTGFEWVQRTVKDDNGKILGLRLYARYVGE